MFNARGNFPVSWDSMMRFSAKSIFAINPGTITICSVLLVAALFLVGAPILDMVELKTYDLRFLSRGNLSPTPAVVLALIDEKSIKTEGRWPWPRSKMARLVDILSEDGAKVIGFDIGFLEPDENSRLGLIDELASKVEALSINNDKLEKFIDENKKDADNDAALAKAIKNSSAAVVLGYFFHMSEADLGYRLEPEKIEQQLKLIGPSKYPLTIYDRPDTVAPFIKAYAPQGNLEIFTRAAAGSGHYDVKSDPDGVVRWMPLIIQCGENIFPHLAVACAWNYLNKPQLMVKVARHGVEGIRMGKRFIPTDESGQLLINYLGPPQTFPHISITDILNRKPAKGTFENRIVLVGATAMGIYDMRNTPVSPQYPGVEIHATVIDNILSKNFMSRPDWSKIYDLFAIIVLAIVPGLVLPRLSAIKGFLFAAGLFALHILVSRYVFVNYRLWLNIVYPLLVLSLTYTGLTVYHYVTEERERKKIKGAFKHYVAPVVIEDILKDPSRLKLGGEEKVITVLFSDLEGFTSYSERYTPHEMITLLSEYYERMTEEIFAHQGMLKEYVGDELMALFGAPLDAADHAKRACAAALSMRERRHALGREWAAVGRPVLKARTGINSGNMLVGNLGSSYRFSYGALGDNVNLGSRLEGLNKMYRTEIIVGENTANLLDGDFQLRELDLVQVKGKKKPVRVYELLGHSADVLPGEITDVVDLYAAGLAAYYRQLWTDAMEYFQKCTAILPGDGPSKAMAERCTIYMKSPPGDDWDGVFEHLSK